MLLLLLVGASASSGVVTDTSFHGNAYSGLALVQNNVAHLQADSVMLPHDVAMMPGPVVLITEAPR